MITRKWGFYIVLKEYDDMKIKLLHLKPDTKTSLQKHKQRSELLYIKNGAGVIRKNDEKFYLTKGNFIKIEKNEMHQIINKSNINDLEIIEIQQGKCIENDIIRYDEEENKIPALSDETYNLLKSYNKLRKQKSK